MGKSQSTLKLSVGMNGKRGFWGRHHPKWLFPWKFLDRGWIENAHHHYLYRQFMSLPDGGSMGKFSGA
jgi:hypothetical protein